MSGIKLRNAITTNFNESIIYTTSSGQDLKDEVRILAREQGKSVTDFKIEKL